MGGNYFSPRIYESGFDTLLAEFLLRAIYIYIYISSFSSDLTSYEMGARHFWRFLHQF
jgi:hypothetical protein